MSLVHESLIGVLNRRFVSTYFNTYPGPGFDEYASELSAKLAEESGQALQYGALVTPAGELVVAFGYEREEFENSLRAALERYPQYAFESQEEQRLFELADKTPGDAALAIRAARVESELLELDEARARLARLLEHELAPSERAAAEYWHAHIGTLALAGARPAGLATALAKIDGLDPELEDDRLADQIAVQIELGPTDAFFGGWQLQPGLEPEAIAERIEAWLEQWPASNRRGEMLFYLGLARHAAGDTPGAERAWKRHTTELPEDRHALLSRVHSRDYAFSPTGKNQVVGGALTDPEVAQQVQQLLATGNSLQIRMPDGSLLTGEEAQNYLAGMTGAAPPTATEPGSTTAAEATRYNFAHAPDQATQPVAGPLAIEVVGQGAVPLILIAGLGFDADLTWREFAEANADEYTSHLVTLPGFGDTPPWPMPSDSENFHEQTWTRAAVQALVDYIDTQELENPVVVGHFIVASEVVLRLALDHPERLLGAVVVSTEPSRALGAGTLEQRRKIVESQWVTFFRTVPAETWSRGMFPPATYSTDDEIARRMWEAADGVAVPTMVRWFLEYQMSDAQLELGNLQVPLFALVPSRVSRLASVSWEKLPELRDTDHLTVAPWDSNSSAAFPMHDDPEWFQMMLADFVGFLQDR